MSKFFRQIGDKTNQLGRQMKNEGQKLGRQFQQVKSAVQLLPGAYKDVSKTYGDIEKATSKLNIPVVPEVFGFARDATGGIGNVLSGNFDKGVTQGLSGLSKGSDLMEKAVLFG